jgi:hypothetical protein
MDSELPEIRRTIAIFEKLLCERRAARERLLQRRAQATAEEQISQFDQVIAIQGRAIDLVKTALESFQRQLAAAEAAELGTTNRRERVTSP